MLPTAGASHDSSVSVAAAHLIVQLCLPREAVLRVPGAGELTVRSRLLDRVPRSAGQARESTAEEAIVVDCAGSTGGLLLEARLAVGVVNGVLGLAPPPFGGRLTRIERGILEGTLATLAVELGLPPDVHFGGEPSCSDGWREVIAFSVGHLGHGRLAMSDGFVERICCAWNSNARALAPWLELAGTEVAELDLAGATVGDKVVFDTVAARSANDDWPVLVRCGVSQALAWWRPDGQLVAREAQPDGDVTAQTHPDRPAAMLREPGRRGDAKVTNVQVVAGYAGARCDSGRSPGLRLARDARVVLEAGGKPWAYGELSQVSGHLAVTLMRRREA